jgi:DNA primase
MAELSRAAPLVVLALDADRSGQDAMLRVLKLAHEKQIRLQIAPMPDGTDPADLLSAKGTDAFRTLLVDATDGPTFQVKTLLSRFDLGSPHARDRALDEVAPVLGTLDPDSAEGQELGRYVADRLQADPVVIARRVERSGGRDRTPSRAPVGTSIPASRARSSVPQPLSARERRERALLSMCIGSPAEGRGFLERMTPEHLSSPVVVRAREWLAGHLDDPVSELPRDDDELVSLVTELKMKAEREPGSREAMELNFMQLEQAVIERRIAAAQREGGDPPVELHRQRAELAERIAHWETAGA